MQTTTRRRKVIRFGRDSMGVTLPKEFTDKAQIRVGDVVGVTYDSVLVIVTPEKKPKEENK
ncbi:unnamed protein product [marine sediment metagenome]|uniref:SpoVT-AbrB domain-containing protein n=1 Tax=marine sediment metagenome TaxID=412755 RepID=X1GJC2_9ZZZZ